MAPYLTVAEFKARTVMPSVAVDEVEVISPGFVLARLTIESAGIDSRLRKRYAAPFAAPVPDVVLGWLVAVVTEQAYRKRGIDPTDEMAETYLEDAKRARDEILEAANSDEGLFDLPLRQDTTETGISQGGPYGYSEASPYVQADLQRDAGWAEDLNRRGTGG